MTASSTYEIGSTSGSQSQLTPEPVEFKKGGRLSQLSTLEKILLLLLLLTTVILVAVIIAFAMNGGSSDSSSSSDSPVKGLKTCTSMACATAASNVHSNIDYSVNPCDDFYQFACGKWMAGRVIQQDRSSVTAFTDLQDQMDIILKNILEAEPSSSDSSYTTKAKTLHKSCFNYDLINERGVKPLVDLIESEFGGWPLTTNSWSESVFDLTDMMMKLQKNSNFPLFEFYTSVDNRNSSKRTLVLDQGGLGMPGQKYYQVSRNDSMLMAYQEYIYDIAILLGAPNQTKAEQDVRDIVDFEIELANILIRAEDRRDKNAMYNPMTLEKISINYSQIVDWKRYVYTLMKSPGIEVNNITDEEIVINRSPSYFEKLIPLLDHTPNRTVANYLVWRMVQSLVFTQGVTVRDVFTKYNKAIYGTETMPPRYETCLNYVKKTQMLTLGSLFIRDNFDVTSKTVALEMIEDIHKSFDELLTRNEWMDEKTKEVAKEKNKFINQDIGYPEKLTNETFLETYYENYTYDADQYFENAIINMKKSYQYNMKRLREPVDKKEGLYMPAQVNAFYSPSMNRIMFPAGILQPPFFSKSFPKSLNYGGIGMVIGHEITHGFDDTGRQNDKDGNLVQWWSETAIKQFKTQSQCIIDQYSNFTVDAIKMNLNGINTQGENIADNGGLKQSFRAYRSWVERQGKEEDPLPGLNFTHDQLFFINFAQIWCTLQRDGSMIERIRTGVHSPGRFRVIGTTQNSDDFSRVFNCPKSSFMNPEKKCTVW